MRFTKKHPLFLVLIGAVSIGFPTSLFSEEYPRAVIANLPVIDYSKQCNERGECDRTIEGEVFSTLEKLSGQYLKLGMSQNEVEQIFGRPSDGAEDSWKDVRFGNHVTLWEYAISLSGTTAFYVIFVNGRLDYFGQVQISYMLSWYGKPGWSSVDHPSRDYRFRGREMR